jgi:peptidoglycan/xylan/chitin deacetylase (PgdA/CDA1 family)
VRRIVILSFLASLVVVGCGNPSVQTDGAAPKVVHATDRKTAQNPTASPDSHADGAVPKNADSTVHHPDNGQGPSTASSEQSAVTNDTPKQKTGSTNGTKQSSSHKDADKSAKKTSTPKSSYVNYWNQLPSLQDSGKDVVLTFDDGPSPFTAQLIQTLDAAHIPSVMFWNTYHLNYADPKVLSLLANSPNIMIGDHTVDHPNLLKLGRTQQYREIVDAKEAIERVTGRSVVFFRPPYGNYNRITEDVLMQSNLTCVMWSDDSLDWKYNSDERAILATIKSQLRPGAIILLHDHPYTVKFLPDIIAMIRKQGYGFTTLATPGN